MTAVLGALLLTGCGLLSKENVKLRDLDFTVLSEEKIPEELKTVIAEKGTEPFQLTYSDNQNLYISIGYGEQKTGGYSIAVDALYLTDDAIHVSTSLLGPDFIEKEDGEIHYNGDVCRVFQGSQRPQDNEYDIIGGKDQGSDAHQRSQQS